MTALASAVLLAGMSAADLLGLVISVVVLGYLLFALLRGERL